ncbi:hypothetical protein [Azospirillum sp. ST 5-10]
MDVADAVEVFADVTVDIPDGRRDCGEGRIVSIGHPGGGAGWW